MRIRPTELGLKGMLLLAALELAYLATSYSNLFFLLIAFCCVLGVVGLLGAIANLRGTTVQLGTLPLAAAGAERPVAVTLRSGRRRFDLAVTLEAGKSRIELGHAPMVVDTTNTSFTVPGQTRGVRRPTHVRIASRYPFGLFQTSRRWPIDLEIVTHPAPTPASGRACAGAGERPRATAAAPGSTVAGLRPFRTGDSLSAMHWKATARRGEPIVREREPEAGDTLEVTIDRRCEPAELETALALATGLVLDARAGGARIRLTSQDTSIDAGATGPGTAAALRWLALATTLPAEAPGLPRDHGGLCLPASRGKEPVRV